MGDIALDLSDNGPLIMGTGATRVTLVDLSVASGVAPRGGCLTNPFGNEIILVNMTFSFCRALAVNSIGALGGAIFSTGRMEIDSSRFISNLAFGGTGGPALGGAVYADIGPSQVIIRDSEFVSNTATASSATSGVFTRAGALHQLDGDLSITGSRFALNRSTESGSGNQDAGAGAIYHAGSQIIVRSTVFASNSAEGSGSAIQVFGVSPGVNNSAFIENAVFFDNRGNLGNSINNGAALSVGRATLSLRNSTFLDNRSENGASSLFHSVDLDNLAISNNAFGQSADGSTSCLSVASPDDVLIGEFNFFSDNSCGWLNSTGTQHATLALTIVGEASTLSSPDILPLPASPLVDAGSTITSANDFSVCALVDIDGLPRPQDNDDNSASRCTAGAFERMLRDEILSDRFEN
ncbi:MAG: hypothetical protein AAGJ52_06570 [Pseudomonadota bacterium]